MSVLGIGYGCARVPVALCAFVGGFGIGLVVVPLLCGVGLVFGCSMCLAVLVGWAS